MSISTLFSAATGYLLKGAAKSKVVKEASEELLGAFWDWIAPLFLEAVPELETAPEAPATTQKVQARLLELAEQDATFFDTLAAKVAELQAAGIQEKNIVEKDLIRVKKIKIGDKTYDPSESYTRKNIVKGNVEDADEFILGDGH